MGEIRRAYPLSRLCLILGGQAMWIRLTAYAWSLLCQAIISMQRVVPGVYGAVTDALQLSSAKTDYNEEEFTYGGVQWTSKREKHIDEYLKSLLRHFQSQSQSRRVQNFQGRRIATA